MCDVKVIKKKAKIRSLQKLPDIQYLKIYFLSIKVYSITGTSKCTNVDKPGKVKYDFYHILVRHPREPNVISILLSPVSMGKRQYECPLTFNLCLDEKSEMAVYMYLYSRWDTIFLQNSMNNILDFRQKLIKSSLLTVSLQRTYFRTVVSIEIRKKSRIFQRYNSCILCTGWKNIWKYNVFSEIRQIYLQLNSDS